MNTATRIIAWIRGVFSRPVRPSFASALDEAMQQPFFNLSARALEQSLLLEVGVDPNNENLNPEPSADAGANQ